MIYEENSFGVPVEFKNQQKYIPTHAKIFEFPVINSKKMKCLFREFKKFYNKELKISTLSKIQDANLFEEYAKINGLLSDVEEANFIEAPLSWLSISFHLSLIVNPSLWFSISTFNKILKNYNYLSEEDPLLTVNDILFKPTNKKVRKFLMKKENRILIRNFIAHLSENYREEFTDEISIINNTCDLHD